MPMPTPKQNEDHPEFIARCMSDDVMITEFPDEEQRLAASEERWVRMKLLRSMTHLCD